MKDVDELDHGQHHADLQDNEESLQILGPLKWIQNSRHLVKRDCHGKQDFSDPRVKVNCFLTYLQNCSYIYLFQLWKLKPYTFIQKAVAEVLQQEM